MLRSLLVCVCVCVAASHAQQQYNVSVWKGIAVPSLASPGTWVRLYANMSLGSDVFFSWRYYDANLSVASDLNWWKANDEYERSGES